jgi:uncharacterized membrane protein YtjA (UPF0391 family)
MLNWAAAFFAIAFLGGILGLSGIAAAALIHIAWLLFGLGLALALGFLFTTRRAPFPWIHPVIHGGTMNIIWTILVGFLVGLIARFLRPGPDPAGFVVTVLIGIAGSLVATYGGQALRI